jgi:hypothetical protein
MAAGKGKMAMLLLGGNPKTDKTDKPAEETEPTEASDELASETLLAAGEDLLAAIEDKDAEAVAAALKAACTACMED